MNAGEVDSDDDGIMLAGDGVIASSYDPMLMGENGNNGDLNYQKMAEVPVLSNWMQWFLALEDHEYLIEVDRDFISDEMNLINLKETCFPSSKDRYKECLKLITSNKVPNEDDLQN